MEIDRNGLEVLDRDECLTLLSRATIGRVGLNSGALPTVLPVNFHFDGDQVLILSTEGSKLDAALQGNVVAFEVDDFDTFGHAGWSVVVTGMATVVTDEAALSRLRTAPLARWATAGHERLISISADVVSGRRLHGERLPR